MRRKWFRWAVLRASGLAGPARRFSRFIPALEPLEGRCLLTVFTVYNTEDSGPGSLRQAIVDSNNNPGGPNTVLFQIGSGVQTIFPFSQLDSITVPLGIDGSPPQQFPDQKIELDGRGAGMTSDGLDIRSANSAVFQITIDNFGANGIGIHANNIVIQGCSIGTDPSGTVAKPDGQNGIFISDSANNLIGGATPFERNVISGNGENGIFVNDELSTGNQIIGNYIGTNVSGSRSIPNRQNGVSIFQAPYNTVGGDTSSDENLISGNSMSGVSIAGPNAPGNLVEGNLIGTDATGSTSVANQTGVTIDSSSNNEIGGGLDMGSTTGQPPGNVISGNTSHGVEILSEDVPARGNLVVGNLIGLDITGNNPLANGTGVYLTAGSNTIGFVGDPFRNVISGNTNFGVDIETGGASSSVAGNYIGTNLTGSAGLGNGRDGVLVNRANDVDILTNIISGNGAQGIPPRNCGIDIIGGNNTFIKGNYIGTDQAGLIAIPNSGNGIVTQVVSPSGTVIGGDSPNDQNIISGNGGDGVDDAVSNNTMRKMGWNIIGENKNRLPLRNGKKGASLNGSGYTVANNVVSDNPEGGIDLTGSNNLMNNVISYNTVDGNGGEGIAVHSGTESRIYGNVIYNNNGDGIFLDTGVTVTSVGNNQIGLDQNGNPLGNTGNGIVVNDSDNGFEKNTIWYNQREGIVVVAGIRNKITQNSIYLNKGLGIDLGGHGVYPIHSQPLAGPNVFENYPTLTQVNVVGNTATVSGSIDTGPNTPGLTIYLEFFLSQTEDPSGYGQGQNFVATASVSVTGGVVPFMFQELPWIPSLGTWYTATATPEQVTGNSPLDLEGTSEFSNALSGGMLTAAGSHSSGIARASAALFNFATPAAARLLRGDFIGIDRGSTRVLLPNHDGSLIASESPGDTSGRLVADVGDLVSGNSHVEVKIPGEGASPNPSFGIDAADVPSQDFLRDHLDRALQELADGSWNPDPVFLGLG